MSRVLARVRARLRDVRAGSGGGAAGRGGKGLGDEPRRAGGLAVAALGGGEQERALGAGGRDGGGAGLPLERVAERGVLGGEGAFLEAADEHDLPLEALGAVDGAQRHALTLGGGAAFVGAAGQRGAGEKVDRARVCDVA